MSIAKIYLLNEKYMSEFYFSKHQVEFARQLFMNDMYRHGGSIVVDSNTESAAEECFDLTNNPERQEERDDVYGRGRSISVGDVVSVDETYYLCCSVGWQKI